MARGSHAIREWRDLALRFYRSGIRPVTLSPAAHSPRDRFICRLFRPQRFDSGIALPKKPGNRGFQAKPVRTHEFDRLMRLVAPWPLVDPGLLREIRKLIPGLGAAAEAWLWSHSGSQTNPLGLRLNAEYRERYLANKGLDEADKQHVRELLARSYRLVVENHRAGPLPLRYLEGLIADSLGLFTESITQELKKLLATGYQNRNSARGVRFSSFLSAACELLPESAWEGRYREIIHTMFAVGRFDQLNTENIRLPLPERLDLNQIAWVFPEARGADRLPIRFCQVDGTRLLLESVTEAGCPADSITTNIIAKAESGGFHPIQYSVHSERDGDGINGLISHGSSVPPGYYRVVVRTNAEELEFSADPCPPWASAMGRDERGMFAIIRADGRRIEWCEPGFVVLKEPDGREIARWGFEKGFWHDTRTGGAHGIELVRPEWARGFGVDSIGVYAEFEVDHVVQLLRWMMPGMFAMGASANEPTGFYNETQHDVVLSQGFWLADTACTQALWMVVMGKNPSRYKGKDRPVERVSWDDVQEFLTRLDQRVPGLNTALPTEAQWEYACRAGTTSPFSFGETVNTEQANYDGKYPYRDQDPKGEYRKKTVAVKALPHNA
ncbi:MAG: formylglycine-generating enzyme family protein, partial [Methylococcales bacterium]